MDFDYSFDMIIVGSGAGGHVASLVAKDAGLDVVVLEKTEFFGGSSALSGGGIWAPNNYYSNKAGVKDSYDNALLYLNSTVGSDVTNEKKEAYLKNSPEMIDWLRLKFNFQFQHVPGYSDYHPNEPGGVSAGRAVESKPFNAKKLKKEYKNLRRQPIDIPVNFTIKEFSKIIMITSTWSGKTVAIKAILRSVSDFLLRRKTKTLGAALISQLHFHATKIGIPFWLETPLKQLIIENNKIIGVVAEKNGKEIHIEAKKGVLLSSGGFPHNLEMREKFMPAPQSIKWTSANPGNTGDAIRAGMNIGAATDLMDDAWWGPSSVTPDGTPFFHVGERSYPGSIMVNSQGKRFMNEAASYVTTSHIMYEKNSKENIHIPSYFIFDHQFKRKYIFGAIFPMLGFPKNYYVTGYVKKANTFSELADELGIPANNLVETIESFNKNASEGKDPEYHRGEDAYDNFYGDPTVKPNPNLRPLIKSPFYAVQFYPGDLGTKGGLLTNEHGQVLKTDGLIIEGLYATGNTMASVMGHDYPGPGCTLGSTMTYGFISANNIIQKKIKT